MLRVGLVLVFACSSKSSQPPPTAERTAPPPPQPAGLAALPRVVQTPGVVLDTKDLDPPLLVVVDAKGATHLTSALTWDELATRDPLTGARLVSFDLAKHATEVWGRTGNDVQKLAATVALPPPDDGSESGGTGTLVNLDESQQNPPVPADDPRLRVRSVAGMPGPLRDEPPAMEVGRLASIAGEVAESPVRTLHASAILPSPTAPATTLVDVVTATQARLVVNADGAVKPLRIDFREERVDNARRSPKDSMHWLEIRLGAAELAVETVPDVPVPVAWAAGTPLDAKALASVLDTARSKRNMDPLSRVDVLVEPGVTAQRLVDLLVALDVGGTRMIGLGKTPAVGSPQAAWRGSPHPLVVDVGAASRDGISSEVVEARIAARRDNLRECYTKALATKPALAGVVRTELVIAPTGQVTSAKSTGVDPAVATCIASVIRSIQFDAGAKSATVSYALVLGP